MARPEKVAVVDEIREKLADADAAVLTEYRGLKVHATDLAEFRMALERAFEIIGERYFVHLRGEPTVKVGRDEIRVSFRVDKED